MARFGSEDRPKEGSRNRPASWNRFYAIVFYASMNDAANSNSSINRSRIAVSKDDGLLVNNNMIHTFFTHLYLYLGNVT